MIHENSLSNLITIKWPELGETSAMRVPRTMHSPITEILNQFDRIYKELGKEKGDTIVERLIDSLSNIE
jgi:hypothetical protein